MSKAKQVMINKRYILEDLLGKGGMGEVFLAKDRLSGNTVALKRVIASPADLIFNSQGDSSNLNVALAQEFKTLATLRHPNIISVLDYGFDEQKQPYFTVDYLQNAQSITAAAQGKTEDEKIGLVLDMLQALVYLHQRNILHRDLKPDNILVVDGVVKVMDFGLALATKGSSAQVDGISGTIAYFAPEILQGETVSTAADLYAVGIITYEMLTGQYPFPQNNIAVLINHILNSSVDMLTVQTDVDLIDVLERLMAKERSERFSTAREAITAICEATDRNLPTETEAIRESFLQASTFVGRKVELQHLVNVWNKTLTGENGAILVGGESGVGKSRLLDEFRIRTLVDGALVLRGQAVDNGKSLYNLWRNSFQFIALYSDIKPAQASILKTIIGDINHLVGYEVDDAPSLSPQQARDRLFQTVTELIEKLSAPVVLILEDLHWAGDESLALIDHILQTKMQNPFLLIASYRDDEAQNLKSRYPQMHYLTLKRLDQKGIAELSASMLGQVGSDERIVNLLERETDGNVFFLLETVRVLAEEAGQLANIGHMTLPVSIFSRGIKTVIERRLRHISESNRQLLRLAAIMGRKLDLIVLTILNDQHPIDDWLMVCTNASIVEIHDGTWHFAHDKFREYLLTEIDSEDKAELYRKVAQSIEKAYPNSLEYVATLAHLWRVAGNNRAAFQYAVKAGDRASDIYAISDANQHYSDAMELLPKLETTASERRHLCLKYGRALELANEFGAAIEYYQDMQNLAHTLEDNDLELVAIIGEAIVRMMVTSLQDFVLSEALGKKALILAQNAEDVESKATIQWQLMNVYRRTNRVDEAIRAGEKALELAESHKLQERLAYILHDLAALYYSHNDWERSFSCRERAIALWRELNNTPMYLECVNAYSLQQAVIGRYDYALNAASETLEIAQNINNQWGQTYSYYVMASVYLQKMEISSALDTAEKALRIALESDSIGGQMIMNFLLGSLYLAVGEVVLAEQASENGYNLAGQEGFPLAIGLYALVKMERGNLDDASNLLDNMVYDVTNPDREQNGIPEKAIGYLALYREDYPKSLEISQHVLEDMQNLNIIIFAPDFYYLKAKSLIELGRTNEARQTLQDALAMIETYNQYWYALQIIRLMIELEAGASKEVLQLRERVAKLRSQFVRILKMQLF